MGLTVISLNNVPPKLRGYLTKYLWEINTGVYVGNVSNRVRTNMLRRCTELLDPESKLVMVYPTNNEQGFQIETYGNAYASVDFDGLQLVRKKREKTTFPRKNTGNASTYIVLDFETTGLNVAKDRIIEIGAMRVEENEITDRLQRIIDVPVPKEIVQLTGIYPDEIESKYEMKEALLELSDFIGNLPVIGYNIRSFDARILQAECQRNQVDFPLTRIIDVLDLVRKDVNTHSSKMYEVAREKGIEVADLHRAIPDCFICHQLYQFYANGSLES